MTESPTYHPPPDAETVTNVLATAGLANRFRGFYPVVIDIETSGFDCRQHGILEISAALLGMNEQGQLFVQEQRDHAVTPFDGAVIDPAAIAFHGIDPARPERHSQPEGEALRELFQAIRQAQKQHQCQRSILVAHNAHFDHGFLRAAVERQGIKRDPFHPFSVLDTASLSALAFGQTVLAKACLQAGLGFDNSLAHSAAYDTRKTAELFCHIVNRWQALGGWPH